MKISIEVSGHAYAAELNDNAVAKEIMAQLPQSFSMVRSDDHEYYASLHAKVEQSAEGTTLVLPDHLYYFVGFNAFSINFSEKQIAPYQVIPVGTFDQKLSTALSSAEQQLQINVIREEGKQ